MSNDIESYDGNVEKWHRRHEINRIDSALVPYSEIAAGEAAAYTANTRVIHGATVAESAMDGLAAIGRKGEAIARNDPGLISGLARIENAYVSGAVYVIGRYMSGER